MQEGCVSAQAPLKAALSGFCTLQERCWLNTACLHGRSHPIHISKEGERSEAAVLTHKTQECAVGCCNKSPQIRSLRVIYVGKQY